MQNYRNHLKETIKKLQSPAKNQRSLMYKTLMPDYCNSKLNNIYKEPKQEARPIRTEAIDIKQYRTNKGRSDAKELIDQIYDTRLFQLLNESAKGLTGAHGRRMAENRAVQQQRIIAKALEGHILEKVLTHTSKHEEQLKAHLTTDNQGESTLKNPDILVKHCQTQPISDSDNAKSEKKSEKHEKAHRSLGEQNDVRFKREMKQLLEIDINSDKFEEDDSNIPSF